MELRSTISLLCGFMGVLATTVTALRNASKFDVKAEMFRGAAANSTSGSEFVHIVPVAALALLAAT